MIDETTGNIAFGIGLVMDISQDQARAMLLKAGLKEPKGIRYKPNAKDWAVKAEDFENHLAIVLPRIGLNLPMRMSSQPARTDFSALKNPRAFCYTELPGTEYLALIGLQSGTFSMLFGHIRGGVPHVGGFPVSRTVVPLDESDPTRWEGLAMKCSFLIGSRTQPEADLFGGAQ